MTPMKATFYVYADGEDEIKELQVALNNFVRSQYDNGGLVTAEKLRNAIKRFSNNYIVNQFFK